MQRHRGVFLAFLIHVLCGSASAIGVTFHLDCDAGVDTASGADAHAPVRTVGRVQSLIRSLRAADAAASIPARRVTVLMRGTCGAARFTAADGGASEESRVTYAAAPDAVAPPVLSGGVPVPASWLSPVTDASILEQLPSDAARSAVLQLALGAHGNAIPDAGTLVCKPYMGGEASILPGNLMPSGLEFFAAGSPATGGDFAPLTLARYPNRDAPPKSWSSGTINNYTITPDGATAARLPLWSRQLLEDPDSIFAHYLGGLEWDDAHHAVASISLAPPPAPPSGGCGVGNTSCACFESGYDYDGNDLQPPVAAPTQAACCALCNATQGCKYYSFCPNSACAGGPTMCYLKTSNAGRKAWPNRLSGPATPSAPSPTLTLAPCPSHYNEPGYDALDDKGTCVRRLRAPVLIIRNPHHHRDPPPQLLYPARQLLLVQSSVRARHGGGVLHQSDVEHALRVAPVGPCVGLLDNRPVELARGPVRACPERRRGCARSRSAACQRDR